MIQVEVLNHNFQQNTFLDGEISVVSLAGELIRVPSVRGDVQAMEQVLSIARQQLEEFTYESFEKNGDTSLLFFNRPTRPERFRVLLNAHLDVVSGTAEQFNPREFGGRLYGRGAQDMKSAAAAMMLVFKCLAPRLPYPIALQIVTDEETGGFNGTGYQVGEEVKTDFMITGESTDLHISNQHKGVLVFTANTDTSRVSVDGLLPGHAAYILEGQNAILEAAQFLRKLQKNFPESTSNDGYVTTINPAKIETPNKEHNKVPINVSTTVDIRYVSADTHGLLERIISLLPPNTTINEETIVRGKAHYTDPNNQDILTLRRSAREILGNDINLIPKNGSSDARFYGQSVQFGPVGAGLHTSEEYIEIYSLYKYVAILMKFLSKIGEEGDYKDA